MKLYRYQSLNKNNLLALLGKKFWSSSAKNFNDQFDTPLDWMKRVEARYRTLIKNPDGSPTYVPAKERPKIISGSFSDDIKKHVSAKGLICFCGSITNVLMWTHYSSQHRGFALEFDVPEDALNSGNFFPVEYVDNLPMASALQSARDVVRYKSIDWKYESEYRFQTDVGDKLYDWEDLKFGKTEYKFRLLGIIFGLKMPKSDREIIASVSKKIFYQEEVKLKQAKISDKAFEVKIEDY